MVRTRGRDGRGMILYLLDSVYNTKVWGNAIYKSLMDGWMDINRFLEGAAFFGMFKIDHLDFFFCITLYNSLSSSSRRTKLISRDTKSSIVEEEVNTAIYKKVT
jgi:hypothetical protein